MKGAAGVAAVLRFGSSNTINGGVLQMRPAGLQERTADAIETVRLQLSDLGWRPLCRKCGAVQ